MCPWGDKRYTHGAEMQHESRFISVKSRMGSAAEAGSTHRPALPTGRALTLQRKALLFS